MKPSNKEAGFLNTHAGGQKKVLLLDSTLREGEQTPGVSFTVEQKLKIAHALDELGVDMIEVGHPNVSPDIDQFVKEVAQAGLKAEIVAHCRARSEDIDKALSYGVDRVAVFVGTSKNHLDSKLRKGESEACEMVYRTIREASQHGVKVRFTAEDAPRTDPGYLVEICRAAIDAGADRIGLPDTVGNQTPDGLRRLFQSVGQALPAELDAHCHNDLGLALANSLAAMEGGASCIHVTVNGLGERVGITSLCNLAVALKVLYDIDSVRLDRLFDTSRLVAQCTGVDIPGNMPILGGHAFSHKAGLHTTAVLRDPTTYEAFPPALIGRDRHIVLDKFAGREAVRWKLAQLGLPAHDALVSQLLDAIKRLPQRHAHSDDAFRQLVSKLQQRSVADYGSIPL